ncbi:MAG: PD40 domain-containing protein [Candidatus Rokubacteria bacterium]|nr:PD40 domain-containing protein [Candidatus Rokubacteria bacterium]MBI2526554.1 PD40 domain-containing protein [Candidatus Rokubacteria bacterium]
MKWWDLLAGREAGVIREPSVGRAQISPDGRFLALGGAAGYIRQMLSLSEMAGGREIWRATYEVNTPQGNVYSLAFSPDGRRLLVAGADGTLRLWDTATGRRLRGFTGYPEYYKEVAFAADGRSFLAQLPRSRDRSADMSAG